MRFRPCIDIHNGKIKQIVGGSLLDQGDFATENFVSEKDGTFYGKLYKENHLNGGHIIMLNARDSKYYEEDKVQALKALKAFEGGLQIGGGITDENAKEFIESGASHVIVTSFVFAGGKVHYDRLDALKEQVGREHLVLDLSCRKRDDKYYITTDRWQKFTEEELTIELLHKLESWCDEYLIHGVDVEGKAQGIDQELVQLLARYNGNKVTYAGGVKNFDDLELLKNYGNDKIDVTIGSALDLFGWRYGIFESLRILRCNDNKSELSNTFTWSGKSMEGRLEYMKLLYEASNFTIQARWVIPFAILGIIGVLLLLCSRKPFFKLLAAVCLVICAIAALRFCFGYVQVIQAYKQGNYKNVEGYVENFVPASSGGEDQEDMEEESFDIKGVHFSYGDKFIKKFGYHRPSTQGGYIKKDGQYLKIGYISTEKGYVIVKIQERK